ncbi:hypothetical protein VTO42DRAFT_7526 [Malbranchea cinnamomea]
MARLNLSQSGATTFTIHEDGLAKRPMSRSKPLKARKNGYLPSTNDNGTGINDLHENAAKKDRPQSHDMAEATGNTRDQGSLAAQLTSLSLRESAEDDGVDNENAGPASSGPRRKAKGRRPLGLTRTNPLLLPLSSSSAKKERYSLTNVENFNPKNEALEKEEDAFNRPSRSYKRSLQKTTKLPDKIDQMGREDATQSKTSDEEVDESEEEFDSLDDFIVSDDDISYRDSEDEIEEDENEVILKPKTPRRLFRGRPPPSARRDAGTSSTNTIESQKSSTVNKLPTQQLDDEGISSFSFSLKPTLICQDKQNTPVKKTLSTNMDDGDVSGKYPRKNSSVPASKTRSGQADSVTPPTSPSKPRLRSPAKAKNRIPASPHRPSLETFWDQGVINEWNDSYSPRKTPARRGLAKFGIYSDEEDDAPNRDSPTASPTKSRMGSTSKSSPTNQSLASSKRELLAKKKEFNEKKASIAESFFRDLDELVTGGEIQRLAASTGGVRIIWSKTLNTTAGRANWKREASKSMARKLPSPQLFDSLACNDGGLPSSPSSSATPTPTPESQVAKGSASKIRHHASIELAEKVIDSEDRLLSTLAHEYCHLANYMISNVRDNPHGASFKTWAEKCRAALRSHPVYGSQNIEISIKHSFQINYKYLWCCKDCGCEYGRHSKSIDPTKCRCGRCKGILVQVRPKPRKQKGAVKNKKDSESEGRGNMIDLTEALETVTLEKE